MLDKVKHAATTALDAAAGLVGVRVGEEPAFDVVARLDTVEIRRYAPRLVAETEVAGEEGEARDVGFRRLAGYIFGGNAGEARIAMTAPVAQEGTRIAMTAPVAQEGTGHGHVIRFFLPAALRDPPAPQDPAVRIAALPAETFAVLRFSGSTAEAAVEAGRQRLLAALDGSGWVAEGRPAAWFYDPPWTPPPLRRNEVAVRVMPA